MSENLEKLQGTLNYRFCNPELLVQALCHRSTGEWNNERLEFLGDSVLNFCVAQQLYQLQSEANEGDLSRVRASLVNSEALVKIAEKLQINEFIRLGHGEERSGGRQRKSIMADTVEAMFGAVLLDGGYEQCRRLILRLYADAFSSLPRAEDIKDSKTKLQEYLQGQGKVLPRYEVFSESGKDHEKCFWVKCHVEGASPVPATGNSRRKAEQEAAKLMLKQLTHT